MASKVGPELDFDFISGSSLVTNGKDELALKTDIYYKERRPYPRDLVGGDIVLIVGDTIDPGNPKRYVVLTSGEPEVSSSGQKTGWQYEVQRWDDFQADEEDESETISREEMVATNEFYLPALNQNRDGELISIVGSGGPGKSKTYGSISNAWPVGTPNGGNNQHWLVHMELSTSGVNVGFMAENDIESASSDAHILKESSFQIPGTNYELQYDFTLQSPAGYQKKENQSCGSLSILHSSANLEGKPSTVLAGDLWDEGVTSLSQLTDCSSDSTSTSLTGELSEWTNKNLLTVTTSEQTFFIEKDGIFSQQIELIADKLEANDVALIITVSKTSKTSPKGFIDHRFSLILSRVMLPLGKNKSVPLIYTESLAERRVENFSNRANGFLLKLVDVIYGRLFARIAQQQQTLPQPTATTPATTPRAASSLANIVLFWFQQELASEKDTFFAELKRLQTLGKLNGSLRFKTYKSSDGRVPFLFYVTPKGTRLVSTGLDMKEFEKSWSAAGTDSFVIFCLLTRH
jgi:hypothetical protein